MTKIIEINSPNGYLNLDDLPHNCIFNKVVTGCGGTTIALKNTENYVIAVPYTELIINKLGRTTAGVADWEFVDGDDKIVHQVFGLFGYFSQCKTEFQRYVAADGIKKIICTYDKIPLLEQYINPEDYRLLVDEYHQLLKAYSYRSKAIDGVLGAFRKYKSFCFLSATPLQSDFKPDCLADVDEIRAEWGHIDKLHINIIQTDKPYKKAANIINKYKSQGYIEVDGVRSEEAFFFINSVTDIASILSHCQLNPEEVKIVCADKEANKLKLSGYEIENSRTPSKKFTFLTSKSFEGADYFSPTGIAFVVSSGSNQNTLLSVDTEIPQIAGRIRDTCFKTLLVHIMSANDNLHPDVTYAEYKRKQDQDIVAAKGFIDYFNGQPDPSKAFLRDGVKCNKLYMQYDESSKTYTFNDRLPKLELYNYLTYQEVYKNGLALAKHYRKFGNDVELSRLQRIDDDVENVCQYPSFKEVYQAYSEFKKHQSIAVIPEDLRCLVVQQPLVPDAYQKLGDEVVARLRYSKSKVEDALDALDETKTQDNKIASILRRKLEQGFISASDLKKTLASAYHTVGKRITAKAADIRRWYDADDMVKSINGRAVRGFRIIKPKYIFNDDNV